MWALMVVAVDEVIEAGLLLQEVAGGGFGGFLLQGQVHTLMAAVLFGMAGLDAFDLNTQAQPPHG